MSLRTLCLIAALLVLAVRSAPAQIGYEISWWTVDGGGTMGANGGGFTLAGTVGQPDAGSPLAGGSFSVVGGFWPAAAAFISPPESPGAFHSVTPCRMVDTRNTAGPLGGPALQSGAARTFVVTGVCGVPSSAKALSVTLTVAQPAAAGYLSLMPGDQSGAPSTSAINYSPGQIRTNNAITRLAIDGSGGLKVYSASSVHFILDVNGYFE